MPDPAWGVVDLLLVTSGIAGVLWTVFHADEVAQLGLRSARRLHVIPAAPPVASGMPIERIAADLRRIRPQARRQEAGTPMVRRRAILAAYDEALLEACRALDVPTDLDRIVDALERESERLRTESELQRAGVDLG
jgi:hypothetical protein